MNESNHLDSTSQVSWPQGEHLGQDPAPTILPENEGVPAAQQLSETARAVKDALHVKTDQLRATRNEWTESVRTTVRGNPLAAVAAGVMLGALIARITRR